MRVHLHYEDRGKYLNLIRPAGELSMVDNAFMKKIRYSVSALLLILAASSALFAGDYADLKFIGFSGDGQYMAFEESGEWDGSGGSYATTYYIDVENNKYALPPTVFEWEMDSMKEAVRRPLYNRYKLKVAAGINKLKIIRGNRGKQVVATSAERLELCRTDHSRRLFHRGQR